MLTIDDRRLTTSDGIEISWTEVTAVHADRIDAITHSIILITLEHECGEFIEISPDEDGFDNFRENLSKYLPLPDNWYQQVEDLAIREAVTLMIRGGDADSQ